MTENENALLDQIRRLLEEEGPGRRELREQVERLERKEEFRKDRAASAWMLQRELPVPYHPELPVPRLQIEAEVTDFGATFRYELIYRHHLDHLVAVPLGQTTGSGRYEPNGPRIYRPHRDCFHMAADMKQLGLPAFLVQGDRTEVFDRNDYISISEREREREQTPT